MGRGFHRREYFLSWMPRVRTTPINAGLLRITYRTESSPKSAREMCTPVSFVNLSQISRIFIEQSAESESSRREFHLRVKLTQKTRQGKADDHTTRRASQA